ncbi:MAG: PHP domain-containing protein [Chloroflexi bacterium]|nr:MAG: PHP domain-containing protein [Chloroflexota bacterium]
MSRVDLHAHTTISDGTLTPRELVELAVEKGLVALGITDHDTTDGVPEALRAGQELGLWVVPGVELNTDTEDGHLDILGYFIDISNKELQATLSEIRNARYYRAKRMVEKLRELGRPISFERVLELSTEGAVGRPHVAQALLEAGYVSSISEAFELYIGRHGPAYADRYRMSPEEACALVRRAGGVPSLAHPTPASDPFSDPKDLNRLLPILRDAGLGALECYYPGYTSDVSAWLLSLAERFDLIPTGGSDFHGAAKPDIDLGMVEVPLEYVERLRAATSKQ